MYQSVNEASLDWGSRCPCHSETDSEIFHGNLSGRGGNKVSHLKFGVLHFGCASLFGGGGEADHLKSSVIYFGWTNEGMFKVSHLKSEVFRFRWGWGKMDHQDSEGLQIWVHQSKQLFIWVQIDITMTSWASLWHYITTSYISFFLFAGARNVVHRRSVTTQHGRGRRIRLLRQPAQSSLPDCLLQTWRGTGQYLTPFILKAYSHWVKVNATPVQQENGSHVSQWRHLHQNLCTKQLSLDFTFTFGRCKRPVLENIIGIRDVLNSFNE